VIYWRSIGRFRHLVTQWRKYGGWDLSALGEYRPEEWYRRDPSSQTGVPVRLTLSMNSHGIYSINLPD
jgi:hypothetical protein